MINLQNVGAGQFWLAVARPTKAGAIRPASVLAAFADDFEFAMSAEWSGSARLTDEVVRLAQSIVSRFGGSRHLIEVFPGKDGSLSLIWDDDSGNYVYLDVGPGKTVHLYYDVVGAPKWEGVSVAGDPRLVEHMDRAFQALHRQTSRTVIAPPTRNQLRSRVEAGTRVGSSAILAG